MRRKKMFKKIISLCTAGAMLAAMLSGCNWTLGPEKVERGENDFVIWSTSVRPESSLKDYTESPFHQGLAKSLGKNLIWEFPVSGTDANQAFNLMIAGGDLPDIIIHNPTDVQAYIDQGIILPLNEYIEKGWCPNLKKFLEEHPDIDQSIKTDAGDYYMFPWCRVDDWMMVFRGPAVRKDWLEECNLEAPVTLDDYDKVAHVFKEKYNAVFSTVDDWFNEGFVSAFDTTRNYYLDDNGKVQYGPVEDNFRKYLEFMNYWYEEGILDKDLPSIDGETLKKKVLNNQVGIAYTSGNTITTWADELKANGSDAEWMGTSYPRKTKDATVEFSQFEPIITGIGGMITSNCHDVKGALEILDYAYSEEGHLHWNFGIEGEDYTMVDGEPVYTDKILKSPLGVVAALDQNIGTQWGAPAIQDKRMYTQKQSDEVIAAIDTWASNTNMKAHLIPRIIPTQVETDNTSNIETTISDYMKEMYFKFIQGQVEINDKNWNAYVKKINDIGLQQVLDTKNAQVDRFNNR